MSSSLRCSSGKVALISGQILSPGKLVDKMLLQSSPKTAANHTTKAKLYFFVAITHPKISNIFATAVRGADE